MSAPSQLPQATLVAGAEAAAAAAAAASNLTISSRSRHAAQPQQFVDTVQDASIWPSAQGKSDSDRGEVAGASTASTAATFSSATAASSNSLTGQKRRSDELQNQFAAGSGARSSTIAAETSAPRDGSSTSASSSTPADAAMPGCKKMKRSMEGDGAAGATTSAAATSAIATQSYALPSLLTGVAAKAVTERLKAELARCRTELGNIDGELASKARNIPASRRRTLQARKKEVQNLIQEANAKLYAAARGDIATASVQRPWN
jgi:hypothetical protein